MCIHNASGLSMQLNTRPANKWKKKKKKLLIWKMYTQTLSEQTFSPTRTY